MTSPHRAPLRKLNKPMDIDSVQWGTPQELVDELDREFNFNLDPCAADWNHKCPVYYTIEDNGLLLPWAGRVFMNPPYAWNMTARWVSKALHESRRPEVEVVVGLLPVRTDTNWFHEFVYGKAEIRFIRQRVNFLRPDGTSSKTKNASMVVIWR